MKRLAMTVVAAITCLSMSAEREMVIPTMGCEEQTVVKMPGKPAEVADDGNEVVYHQVSFRGIQWDRVTVKYKTIGNLKVMKRCTFTQPCRNAQEAYDLNAGLQQLLRRDYGWLDHNADDDSWMTYQGGEAKSNRYAFTLSTKKEDKTNIVSLALY